MTSLESAIQNLIAMVKAPQVNPHKIQDAIDTVLECAEYASVSDRNRALRQMAALIPSVVVSAVGYLAIACGILVDGGADPHIALNAVLTRLWKAVAGAGAFVEACEAAALAAGCPSGDGRINPTVVAKFGRQTALRMPENAAAWQALDMLCRAAIVMLEPSKEARRMAHSSEMLRTHIRSFPTSHDGIGYVSDLLRVLDDEELLVLHPSLKRGYRVKISGISHNFQLYTLLADALIGDPAQGWLPGERPDPRVAAAARDQPLDPEAPTARTAFDLVTWHGLQPDCTLMNGPNATTHWIWGDEIPADIPAFERSRVVMVAPPSSIRTWSAGRVFEGMHAHLQVIETLRELPIQGWLNRLSRARR